jgi:hypothetical protein
MSQMRVLARLWLMVLLVCAPGVHAQGAADLELLDQLGGSTQAVAAAGGYVFLGMGPRVLTLDVSNPTHVTVLGRSAPLPAVVTNLKVDGPYVYAIAGGLHILDAHQPLQLTEIGAYPKAFDVAIAEPYAYVAAGEDGLKILDVTNPTQPVEIGTSAVDQFSDVRVFVAGNLVLTGGLSVWFRSTGQVRVIDVSDPMHPTETGGYSTYLESEPLGLAVLGASALVAEAGVGWSYSSRRVGQPRLIRSDATTRTEYRECWPI